MAQAYQSNTQQGRLTKSSVTQYQGYEGFAMCLFNNAGYGSVQLPTSSGQKVLGIVANGSITQAEVMQQQGLDWGPAGSYGVDIWPLSPDRNMRVYLYGSCNAGDTLVLAPPAQAVAITFPFNFTTSNTTLTIAVAAGLAQSLATAGAGTWAVLGQAEENGVQGQSVLFRPWVCPAITQ